MPLFEIIMSNQKLREAHVTGPCQNLVYLGYRSVYTPSTPKSLAPESAAKIQYRCDLHSKLSLVRYALKRHIYILHVRTSLLLGNLIS